MDSLQFQLSNSDWSHRGQPSPSCYGQSRPMHLEYNIGRLRLNVGKHCDGELVISGKTEHLQRMSDIPFHDMTIIATTLTGDRQR